MLARYLIICNRNRVIKLRNLLYFSLVFASLYIQAPTVYAIDPIKYPEVNQQVRDQIALSRLKKEVQAVALYVKGLCCPSCAIGVRIKIAKLDFVDHSRFKKGVDLDAKHQIVTVALKSGHVADALALTKAVADAGYDAMHLYTLKAQSLHTEQLRLEE